MNIIYLLIILIIPVFCIKDQTTLSKYPFLNNPEVSSLKLVQMVFRHGERNPMSGIGLNLMSESDWPGGFGQLTETGKWQSFELGRYIRKRYSGFLRTSYSYKEVYVRSTDSDRTLATAQGVLAGLYPYTENDLTNFGIPVHTTHQNNETLLRLQNCPRLNKDFEGGMNTAKIKDFLAKNKDVTDYLFKKISIKYLTIDALILLDNLKIQKSRYNKLPNNLDEKTFDKLMKIFEEAYDALATNNNNDLRIGGPLLKELIDHMTMKKYGVKELKEKTLFMYSVHDIQVTAILNLLGKYIQGQHPPNLASVILELYGNTSDNYYVKLFYRNTTLNDPYPLSLEGCSATCPLETFMKILVTEKFKGLDKSCD